jgi:dihydrofolate reductase
MGRSIVEMTVSLDGYATGRDVDVAHPFGSSGRLLYQWHESDDALDAEAAKGMMDGTGAFVIGRTMYDVGIGTWGADGAFGMECFVVTRRPHQPVHRGPTTFTFVTEGVAAAMDAAQAAAGERAVVIAGGPTVAQQAMAAGMVDELRLHVRPILLGAGTRLLDNVGEAPAGLHTKRVTSTSWATHMSFDLAP